MKLLRTFCVPLTNYCTGGCAYCIQDIRLKGIKDTDEYLHASLLRFRKLIKSIKDNFEVLNQVYYMQMHLMGGELLESPEWFQNELVDILIEEHIWDYVQVKIFTNGKNIMTAPLVLRTVKHEHLRNIEWLVHVLNYRKYSYKQLCDWYDSILPHKVFIVIITPQEFNFLNAWSDIPKEWPVPIFFNSAKGHSKEEGFNHVYPDRQKLCIHIQNKTPYVVNNQLSPNNYLLRRMRYICFELLKHGSTPISTCIPEGYSLCCGHLELPKNFKDKDKDYVCDAMRGINDETLKLEYCEDCLAPEGYLIQILYEDDFNSGEIVKVLRKIEELIPPHSIYPKE